MSFGSKVPHLAQRPLAVGAIERNEASELVPAGVELTPLLEVLVLVARLLENLLCSHIAVFHAESALVHSPERHSSHGEVEACCHLCAHVLPTGANVATPCGCGETLFAGEAAAGEQEHALVVVNGTLTVIYSVGINHRVGIEILLAGAHGGRTAEQLAILYRRAVAHVRLRGVHPPAVDAEGVEIVVHLLPEELACACGIGIVERTEIAGTHPVADVVLYCLLIHPSVFVEGLVVVGGRIVFRPVGDEYACVVVVDEVNHSLRVGEALEVELEAAPLVLFPVEPVLHHHIDRNLALAELGKCSLHLLLGVVLLAALPETESPLRHHLSAACEEAVALDDVVVVVAGNEVVVHLLVHLRPY